MAKSQEVYFLSHSQLRYTYLTCKCLYTQRLYKNLYSHFRDIFTKSKLLVTTNPTPSRLMGFARRANPYLRRLTAAANTVYYDHPRQGDYGDSHRVQMA